MKVRSNYYYYVRLKIKTKYFQVLLYFSEIERCFETRFQACNMGFMIFLK
jgi:hypothetical protein